MRYQQYFATLDSALNYFSKLCSPQFDFVKHSSDVRNELYS